MWGRVVRLNVGQGHEGDEPEISEGEPKAFARECASPALFPSDGEQRGVALWGGGAVERRIVQLELPEGFDV